MKMCSRKHAMAEISTCLIRYRSMDKQVNEVESPCNIVLKKNFSLSVG